MKKVLIVSHLLYASPRIPGLAKYLPEFGWQPVILTVPISGTSPHGPSDDFAKRVRIIETPYSDIFDLLKKLFGLDPSELPIIGKRVRERLGITSKRASALLRLGGAIICYPDECKGWKDFAVKAGSEFLESEGADAIISSSSPVTSHLIAKELKTRYKIPWVADLRDLWSQNHYYPYGSIRRLLDRRLELKTLSIADALVTVSQPWAEELRTLHKVKLIYSITNGFDPEKLNDPPAKLIPKFTITYTGTIYAGKQDPSKLFAALQSLISGGTMDPKDIEVRFYGYKEGWLAREIEKYGLPNIAKQYGVMPRRVAFEKQRESQILLLLNWEDPRVRGWYPLKMFEYLAAQRPILATGGMGGDVIEELLDETKAGMYGSKVEDIKSILSDLYSEYRLKGEISYNGDRKKIDKYSYREMAKKFAKILNDLT